MPKPTSPSEPTPASLLTVVDTHDDSISSCFQCGKCSTGCPVADIADLLPHRIVRLAQLGMTREPMTSEHIWNCTGCGTCSSRCPNEVRVAELMDHLKAAALTEVVPLGAGADKIAKFHALFNKAVCKYGRSYELGTLRKVKTSREMIGQARLGIRMLRSGKIRLRPARIRDRKEIRELFRRAGVSK